MAQPTHPTPVTTALTIRERYHAVTQIGFPANYPVVQFPNLPLTVGLLASVVGGFVTGTAQDYVTAVGTIGIAVWAWEEAFQGVNLVRHLLGIAMLVNTIFTLADRIG